MSTVVTASFNGWAIVSLSSVGHKRSQVIFDDLNFDSHPYDIGLAYGQSKTANVQSAPPCSFCC